MRDWNDIDAQAASEGFAIAGGFKMKRNHRSKAPASRQSIQSDYRVRAKAEKKIDRLAMLGVVNGRAK